RDAWKARWLSSKVPGAPPNITAILPRRSSPAKSSWPSRGACTAWPTKTASADRMFAMVEVHPGQELLAEGQRGYAVAAPDFEPCALGHRGGPQQRNGLQPAAVVA